MTATLPPLTERDFMTQVCQLAELRGWSWAHFRPAQTMKGWRTAVCGPLGKGFPDLVLVRNDPEGGNAQIIFAEVKSDTGKLTPDQEAAQHLLSNWQFERNTDCRVWRPSDWDSIMEDLR